MTVWGKSEKFRAAWQEGRHAGPGAGRPGGRAGHAGRGTGPARQKPGVAPGRDREASVLARLHLASGPVSAGPSGAWAGLPGVVPGRPAQGPVCREPRQQEKHVYENGDIFCIRTPFLMILGSLESQQQALHYYA